MQQHRELLGGTSNSYLYLHLRWPLPNQVKSGHIGLKLILTHTLLTGSNNLLPAPATSREPSERLLEQRKKVAYVGHIPRPTPVQAPSLAERQEFAERQQRTEARTQHIRQQQQLDQQNRVPLPLPLTEEERQTIATKKHEFASNTESIELTNKALSGVRQTMNDLHIQAKQFPEKPKGKHKTNNFNNSTESNITFLDTATALALLDSISKITLSDQQVLDKYMNYMLLVANCGKVFKSPEVANNILSELATLPDKLGTDPHSGKCSCILI